MATMAGKTHFAAALLLALLSCSDDSSQAGPDAPAEPGDNVVAARQAVLSDVANKVVLSTYAEFSAATAQMTEAIAAWSAAPNDATARAGAQDAWKRAKQASLAWE